MDELAQLGQAPDLNLNLNLAKSCNCCNGAQCGFNIFRRCCSSEDGGPQTLVYDQKKNVLSRKSISRIPISELHGQCSLTLRAFILAEEARHGTALYHVGCMVAGVDLDNRLEGFEGERRSVDWRAAFPDVRELRAIEDGVEDAREWAPAAARLWKHRIKWASNYKRRAGKLVVTWPKRTPKAHKLDRAWLPKLNAIFTVRELNKMKREKHLNVEEFACLIKLARDLDLESEPFEDGLRLHRILGRRRCQGMAEMGKLQAWQTARKDSADKGQPEMQAS